MTKDSWDDWGWPGMTRDDFYDWDSLGITGMKRDD